MEIVEDPLQVRPIDTVSLGTLRPRIKIPRPGEKTVTRRSTHALTDQLRESHPALSVDPSEFWKQQRRFHHQAMSEIPRSHS